MVIQRGTADVDGDNVRCWICIGNDGCLVGAAAGYEDVQPRSIVPVRPEQPMGVAGIKPLPTALEPLREVPDGGRIHPFLVLAGDDVAQRIRIHAASLLIGAASCAVVA